MTRRFIAHCSLLLLVIGTFSEVNLRSCKTAYPQCIKLHPQEMCDEATLRCHSAIRLCLELTKVCLEVGEGQDGCQEREHR
ncbi:hypothetical protein AB6A40_011485, partial [Gnathostoma spinigerum]